MPESVGGKKTIRANTERTGTPVNQLPLAWVLPKCTSCAYTRSSTDTFGSLRAKSQYFGNPHRPIALALRCCRRKMCRCRNVLPPFAVNTPTEALSPPTFTPLSMRFRRYPPAQDYYTTVLELAAVLWRKSLHRAQTSPRSASLIPSAAPPVKRLFAPRNSMIPSLRTCTEEGVAIAELARLSTQAYDCTCAIGELSQGIIDKMLRMKRNCGQKRQHKRRLQDNRDGKEGRDKAHCNLWRHLLWENWMNDKSIQCNDAQFW